MTTDNNSILELLMDSPDVYGFFNTFQTKLLDERKRREEFYDWVKDDIKAEFINGEVIVHSPVKSHHAQASDNTFRILSLYALKHKLGRVTHEKVMARFTRNDYEPDVMFFKKEKADTITPTQSLFPVPDFIIEVVSDATEIRDRGVKFRDYEAHQVQEYWLIDVEKRVIEQYVIERGQYELRKKTDEGVIHCVVLQGLDIPVSAIFEENSNFEFVEKLLS